MKDKIETIILISCLHFDCKPDQFFSPSRERKATYARTAAAVLIRKHTTMTLNEIGRLFNRSRENIWACVNRVSQIIDEDVELIESKVSNAISRVYQ